MSHTVTVAPSGRSFSVEAGETVLEAALRQNIVLPYGCRNGACGNCKALVVEGEVFQGPHQAHALTDAERAEGRALMCCARPETDLRIEARVVSAAGDIAVRKMPCRVQSIERATDDVAIVRLQLPANERFQYLAGQYVDLILRDGTRRSYSLATPPGALEAAIELHVRHVPGGRFTDALFGAREPAVKVRDVLRFEGPLGTFFLRDDTRKPVILVASGTGFAPIAALVEQARAKRVDRPMTLYWGARRPADLYRHAQAEAWAREIAGFRYVPVVSDARPEDGWTGRTGFVHRAVMDDFADLSGHEVYACGAPVVVDSARADFTAQRGLPDDAFFADAFTTAADAATLD